MHQEGFLNVRNETLKDCKNIYFNPLPEDKILDSSKLKEFADDNFKFDENDKVIQTGRKHSGKRRNFSS